MRSSPRRTGRWITALLLACLALGIGADAQAGHDDFEFGRKLAESRMFDYARMVFEAVLANSDAPEEDKDEARYGLAILTREEAVAATGRADVTQDDVAKLFEDAASGIETFVQKNPKNKHADTARLDLGTVRLAYVQWARELLNDPEEMQERNFDVDKLRDSAATSIQKAIDYFGQLKPKPGKDPKPLEEMADYYYVISQYFAALVEPPCSERAVRALQRAGELLDDYIMMHEGQLLGIYAMDIYGLVWWERAKCEESNEEDRQEYYNKAYEWFEACINTTNETPDHERVITSGYYHIGQLGLDAANRGGRDFERMALTALESMLEAHPTAWRTDNGLRAMIEWSKLECQRENASQAVQIAQMAGEKAKQAGKGYLERLANRQLNHYVSGGCGGSLGGMNPEVLLRVAEDLYGQGKYADAIQAFRKVIASSASTSEGFLTFRWRAWERIAEAYRMQDDWLGMALALQPIHEAWMNGLIPHEKGQKNDPNTTRAGNARRRAGQAYKMFADVTQSAIAQKAQKSINNLFPREYPDHIDVEVGVWNSAIDKFATADKGKKANNANWRGALGEAKNLLRQVATNKEQSKQDQAWVYLVRAEILGDNLPAAVKVADEALAFAEQPAQKAHAEKFESVRSRRQKAQSELAYWKSEALMKQDKAEEAAKVLEGYLTRFPNVGRTDYPASYALSNQIKALLSIGDIAKADVAYRELLRRDPKFRYLSNITFDFAGHYSANRKVIEEELGETTRKINEVKPALRNAEKNWHRLSQDLSDTKALLTKYEQALKLFEANQKVRAQGGRPNQVVDPNVLKDAKLEREEGTLKKRSEELERKLHETKKEWDRLQPEMEVLLAKRHELRDKLYPPTRKAAEYYKTWDDALKMLEKAEGKTYRNPTHLDAFGQMWWTLGRLRPGIRENWENAQGFYEDFLSSPNIKRRPDTDPEKRKALARLGDVYIRLAETETDKIKRREYVTRAVDLLQSAIAKDPRDNDLVVSMLANKVLVLRWKDPDQKWWRFPIPVPATVTELRKAAQNIGKDDDPFIPAFENEGEKRRYLDALRKFRNRINQMDDKRLKSLLPKEGSTPFDSTLYEQLAESAADYRLALAWAYSKTGRDEDVPKAVNLLLTFLKRGRLEAEEDSEEFWQANDIFATLYLDTAARWLGSETMSADTATLLDQVGERIKRLHANFAQFGEDTIEGNGAHWKALLARLNELRRQARLPTIQLKLITPSGNDETPAPPADPGN